MKIALLSPKGPLYRNRGGIFKKSLRYQPLTLTTLAALVPAELAPEFALYDEGIGDVPLDLAADIVGITIITGSARSGYELARHYRARGMAVVLGGPHVTLLPEEAMQHADAVCVGYAEETWPRLLRDFTAGRMQRRYDQGRDFTLTNLPYLFMPLGDDGMMMGMMMGMGMGSAAECTAQVLPSLKLPLDFTVLMDPEKQVTAAWKVRILPASFLIARDGRVRYTVTGAIDWSNEHVVRLVSELLP